MSEKRLVLMCCHCGSSQGLTLSLMSLQANCPDLQGQQHHCMSHRGAYLFICTTRLVCLERRSPTEVTDLSFKSDQSEKATSRTAEESHMNNMEQCTKANYNQSHMGEKEGWVNMSCDTCTISSPSSSASEAPSPFLSYCIHTIVDLTVHTK